MDKKTYYNYTNEELANAYVDLCAYSTPEANVRRVLVRDEIINRFVERYADKEDNNEDCEDFHLTDK